MAKRGLEYLQSDAKRNLDILAGAAIACALSPAALALAPVVALNTRTPRILFTQERVGEAAEPFDVIKFRTIPIDRQHEQTLPVGSYDHRASKIGMAMRDLGVDEVPQIYNVLNGDMSLVGPRPLLAIDIERLQSIDGVLFDEWYDFYSNTKPGLVGPSQFMRHEYRVTEDSTWVEGMRLDIDYAEAASLRADMRIILSSPFRMALARARMNDNSHAAESVAKDIEEFLDSDPQVNAQSTIVS
jgi:putative colanic acid biosysnthesis UDP-glucose lipid carrier transferase